MSEQTEIDELRKQSQKELNQIFNSFNAEFKEVFKNELAEINSRQYIKGMLIGVDPRAK
jgi:hypothetical protein